MGRPLKVILADISITVIADAEGGPFNRKTLVLVGPPGVGRRSLISKIVNSNPSLFGTTKAGKFFFQKSSCQ